MCRPRAVAGPLSGTGPARRRRPQTCRGACATDPCPSSRGDHSVDEGKSRVSAHRGPRQPARRPNASDATNTGQRRGRFASAETSQARALFARSNFIRRVRTAPGLPRPSMGRGMLTLHQTSGCRDRMGRGRRAGASTRRRAPVTFWPGAGEWPRHGARSTHRKPARGRRPFRPESDARGACATDPCPACRRQDARQPPARATARASTSLTVQFPRGGDQPGATNPARYLTNPRLRSPA